MTTTDAERQLAETAMTPTKGRRRRTTPAETGPEDVIVTRAREFAAVLATLRELRDRRERLLDEADKAAAQRDALLREWLERPRDQRPRVDDLSDAAGVRRTRSYQIKAGTR